MTGASPGNPASCCATRGFTLVEVVVALAILSLIMLATITSLRTLGNTQGTLDRMTHRVDQVRTVSSFLRDTMESAAVGGSGGAGAGGGGGGGLSLGGSGNGSGGSGSAYFEIVDGALVWKTTVLFGEGFGGSYLVRVSREDDLLVLRWQEPPPPNARSLEWAEAQERTLVLDMEEFDVAWRRDHMDEWHRVWEKGDEVGWVRLQIKAAGRHWPELIMQVPR